MKIEVSLKGDVFKILIDGLLHVYICEPILDLQSWNCQNKFYYIEYKTKNQTIKTEYDSLEKWTQILKQLNQIL